MPRQNQNSEPEFSNPLSSVHVERPTGIEKPFLRSLLTKIAAGNSFFWLSIPGDEARVENVLREVATAAQRWMHRDEPFKLAFWDPKFGASFDSRLVDPATFLQHCCSKENLSGDYILVVRDMHLMLNAGGSVLLRRQLIQMSKASSLNIGEHVENGEHYEGHIRPVFILADSSKPHPDIREYLTLVEMELPNETQMRLTAVDVAMQNTRDTLAANKLKTDDIDNLPAEHLDKLSESLLGLTSSEGYKIMCEAIADVGPGPQALEYISDAKAVVLAKTDGLTYVPNRKIRNPDTVGGYDTLMQYLKECRHSYTKHAKELQIERPRGMALIGPPGTGKTTVGNIAAKVLGLDLMLLNVNELFEGVVGGTEQKVSRLIKTLKPMRKFALLIDEVDKLFASAHQTQRNDGGVNARLFKSLLEFMSDRSAHDAFVIMTLNRAEGVGPELFRSGRVDRVFYTPLPSPSERMDILNLHLRLRNQDPKNWKLDSLQQQMDGFAGAEIENLVTTAMRSAYAAFCEQHNREPAAEEARPTIEQWQEAVAQITPSSKFDSANLQQLEDFQKSCGAVHVGRSASKTATKGSRRVQASNNAGLN